MSMAVMQGTRLAYVVTPLPGKVKREQCVMEERPAGKHKDGSPRMMHELKRVEVEEPAGYMVYMPRGHAVRVRTLADLKRYGIDKEANIVNLDGLMDRNSPLGRLVMEQDQAARQGAFQDLKKAVIALATRKSGTVLMPEQVAKEKVNV